MGDFTYLGRETLVRAQSLIAQADAAFDNLDRDAALAALRPLLEECFSGGGCDGPDDGAVDQLVTVVEAMGGSLEDGDFLLEQAEEDGVEYDCAFLKSYALDDLRDTIPWSIAQLD